METENLDIRRSFVDLFDLSTFLVAISLIAIGLISIYSATYEAGSNEFFQRQAIYALAGLAVMFIITVIPERLLESTAYIGYAASIVLLALVPAIGTEAGGAKSWLYFGSFGFQPSEVAKIGTLLALARFIAQPNTNLGTLRDLGIALGIMVLPLALVLSEPDPGTATVYMVMFLGVVLWAGADLFILFAIVAPGVTAVAAFFGSIPFYIVAGLCTIAAFTFRRRIVLTVAVVALILSAGFAPDALFQVLKPHQRQRIEVLLNPESDPRGAGYHVIQSKIAIGSGGLTGKGFLQGTQTQLRYIPEQRTDFIYCVPTEEFGFIGGMLVIGLLTGLVLRAVKIAEMVKSRFASTLAIGIAVIWLYHTTINIGMAIGLMPVMGIPLPFMSAGGTSLVINMAMVGLLLNFFRKKLSRTVSYR